MGISTSMIITSYLVAFFYVIYLRFSQVQTENYFYHTYWDGRICCGRICSNLKIILKVTTQIMY